MRGNFTDIFSVSLEWTKVVLFKPFNLKKWFFLFLIASFAFQLNSCSSSNVDLPSKPGQKPAVGDTQSVQDAQSPPATKNIADIKESVLGALNFPNIEEDKFRFPVFVIAGVLVIVAIIAFFQWIYSIFTFIYIESIVKNDASIKKPFASNKGIGNSFFLWNIGCVIVFLAIFSLNLKMVYDVLVGSGVFNKGSQIAFDAIFLNILPYIFITGLTMTLGGLLSFFINDYVVIIMYKDKTPILRSISSAFLVLKANLGNSIKYFFIKLCLAIAAYVIAGMIGIVIIIALLLPIGAGGYLFYTLYKMIPASFHILYFIFAVLISTPILFSFIVISKMILLPFSVFLRTFNIKFISRLDNRYDLFTQLP